MRKTIEKTFYRNGQLREAVPLQNGRRHGLVRAWHKNGQLASEEHYKHGLLDGVCQQWDESGQLLGEYEMIRGTGIQRAWHVNGTLQLEFSTVGGIFSGSHRQWLHDGSLLSEGIYLRGRSVTAEEYQAARACDKTLPKLSVTTGKPLPESDATDRHAHEVFVHSLLAQKGRSEAKNWLENTGGSARSLGRFPNEQQALRFVAALYEVGAPEVIAADIYDGKNGDQFADCLIVRLPVIDARRKTIRKVCIQLPRRKIGALLPDKDIGEKHLYLSLA